MPTFTVPVFSTAQFSFHKETSAFVAEVSDLDVDALPVWFKLKSAITGKEMDCVHRQTHADAENDITHWEFEVCDPARGGAATALKVTIFND